MKTVKYKAHKSSILISPARLLLLATIILGVIINLVSTLYVLGWIPAMVVYYMEKKSIFVKYHSLLIVFTEIVKGLLLFILTIISLQFDIPYFYGVFTDVDFNLGIMGYIDIGINTFFLLFQVFQIWKICTYSEFGVKFINKILYYFMKKDPKFYEMQEKMNVIE